MELAKIESSDSGSSHPVKDQSGTPSEKSSLLGQDSNLEPTGQKG
jgi:hypothetical protein